MKKSNILALAIILSAGIVSLNAQAVSMQSLQEKAKAAGQKAWQHKGKIAVGIGTAAAIAAAAYAAKKRDVEQIFRDNEFAIDSLNENDKEMAIMWGKAAAAGPSSLQLFFDTAPPPLKRFYLDNLNQTEFAATLAQLARVPISDLPGISKSTSDPRFSQPMYERKKR